MNFYRDTWLEINLDAIFHNVYHMKKYYAKDKKIFAVVKADGYGHGAVMTALTALDAGADYLAVATLDEAIELRKNEIEAPILVLGNMRVDDLTVAYDYDITITIHSLNWLKEAIHSYKGKKVKVHFKVDTGMHRIGFYDEEELIEGKKLIDACDNLVLSGIFTHMATSEEDDEFYFRMQEKKFKEMLSKIDTKGLLIHLSNSAATIKYHVDFTNAVRLGIIIYGLKPKKDMDMAFEVKQAISLYAKLVQVKQLPKGSRISYNGIYETKEEEWIGTLAIGYADGWDRRLINGEVYIDNHYCPVVGRICMDQTMVQLPYEIKQGSIVELIGPHIHVDELANKLNTINYQVVCMLTDRLPRVFIKDGKVIGIQNRRINNH